MKTACALCFVLLLAFTGCDTVTVDKPFGDRMEPSRLERFVGKWMDREANHFELRLSKNRELVGGHLEWDEEAQSFTSKTVVLDVRSLSNSDYLFLTESGKTVFFRIDFSNTNQLKLFFPDPRKFRDAVSEGTLSVVITPKKNDHFDVKITTDEKLTSFLSKDGWKKYFLEEPLFEYTRLGSKN